MRPSLSNFLIELPEENGGDAYIGLREGRGETILHVPHGYSLVEEGERSRILGELTRAVTRFCIDNPNAGQVALDGVLKHRDGPDFRFGGGGIEVGYSKFSKYLELFRLLGDPRLLSLIRTPGLTNQFDHRHIARNLERATFLSDGTPIFENQWGMRSTLRRSGNDMVGLACWMALDILYQLFPDAAVHEISPALLAEWEELARRFAEEYEVDGGASLVLGSREETLQRLQTVLDLYVRRFPAVSSDACELHHLLDELLNSQLINQDGEIWGLKGFHHVWEAACLEAAISEYGEEHVFTCDHGYIAGISPKKLKDWDGNRVRTFEQNRNFVRRPDFVARTMGSQDGKEAVIYKIVDFKYYGKTVHELFLQRPSIKLEELEAKRVKAYQDITNIEAYRWLLMQHELKSSDDSRIKLEFWLPGDEEKRVDCSWFPNLVFVYKPARKIIADYAARFDLLNGAVPR